MLPSPLPTKVLHLTRFFLPGPMIASTTLFSDQRRLLHFPSAESCIQPKEVVLIHTILTCPPINNISDCTENIHLRHIWANFRYLGSNFRTGVASCFMCLLWQTGTETVKLFQPKILRNKPYIMQQSYHLKNILRAVHMPLNKITPYAPITYTVISEVDRFRICG